MTRIVVQKYGGSSLSEVAKIRRVAERIASTRADGKQVCVVVSAMGATTDQLLALAKEISEAPSRRELDMLLTCGERVSMALLSMAVSELGYEAISFTGSQSGIMTNDRHSGARIIEVRPIRVQDELERGRVVIVAGFQGVSYKREITTLGRGGSDTTAVALAGALGAEYCEICSDVDGVYSADPRIVDAATLLDAISRDEMAELSAHGARVLHAESIEFARKCDVALYARATASPANPSTPGAGGTRIDGPGAVRSTPASGVTGCKNLVAGSHRGGADRLVAALDAEGIPLLHCETGAGVARCWFALDDVPDWTKVRARLVAAGIELSEQRGAVTVVGAGLGASASCLVDVLACARDMQLPVDALTTSPLRITLFCRSSDVDALTVAMHALLCEPPTT